MVKRVVLAMFFASVVLLAGAAHAADVTYVMRTPGVV